MDWSGSWTAFLLLFSRALSSLLFSSLSSSLLLLFLASARPLSLSSGPPLPATLCLSWPSRLSSPVALYPTPLIHRRLSSFFLLVLPPFPVVYSPQYLSHLPPPPPSVLHLQVPPARLDSPLVRVYHGLRRLSQSPVLFIHYAHATGSSSPPLNRSKGFVLVLLSLLLSLDYKRI